MYELLKKLFPLRRDLVSDGYDRSLEIIKNELDIDIHEYPSGDECFTWEVPEKWEVNEAYIEDLDGNRVVDIDDHPLHVASYSNPVEDVITRDELFDHLITYPGRPDLIPFGFCYYNNEWSFCVRHSTRQELNESQYRVKIDSEFEPGTLKVGEYFLEGSSDKTVFFAAHLCHPYQANDDLSGITVMTDVAKKLAQRNNLRFNYRFLYLPELIGSLAYLSDNESLISDAKCGIFLEMLGHDDEFTLQYSRSGEDYIDEIAEYVLGRNKNTFRTGAFGEVAGNDERVFDSPGIEVPMVSLTRSDFKENGKYYEYHSHRDTPEIIHDGQLRESRNLVLQMVDILETNYVPDQCFKGPPFLSGLGLWMGDRDTEDKEILFQKGLYRTDGSESLLDVARDLDMSYEVFRDYCDSLADRDLLEKISLE